MGSHFVWRGVAWRQRNSRFRRLAAEMLEDRRVLAPFTPGNLVVQRVGTLFGTLSTAAAPVFLDEINTDESSPDYRQIVQSIPLPTTAAGNQRALTASGTATTDGLLTRSTDGRFLLLTGYNAAPGTPSIVGATSSAVNRVVGRVDAQGNIDTRTAISDGYSGGNIRSAASADGTTIWTSGSSNNGSGGIRALAFGNSGPTTRVSTTSDTTRGIDIFGGQLFVSSGTAGLRLGKVGVGTPTTANQAITGINFPSGFEPGNPHQFFFADLSASEPGLDTLYVADQSATGGLRKYSFVNGSLIYNSNVVLPSQVGQGVRGLTGTVKNGVVTLYATSTEASDNHTEIWKVVDSGGWNTFLLTSGASIFHTGIPGTAFRGVAMAPEALADPGPLADYGDAPDSYHTLAASDGPAHADAGPRLGAARDTEVDGQPTAAASGDDANNSDDEDGITFLTPLLASSSATHTASIVTNASAAGKLDAWIDFNGNGAFDDGSERITAAGGTPVVAGANLISLTIPAGAVIGGTYARFRLSTTGGLLPTGVATDGEVEDYAVTIDSDAGASAAIILPAGGGNYSLETTGGQLRLQNGVTILFATPTNTISSLDIAGGASDVINVNSGISLPGAVGLSSQQINFPVAASAITAGAVVLNVAGGSIVDSSPAIPSVIATTLSATAGAGITLGTNVESLTAITTGAGAISITEADDITLTNVAAANGPITVAATGLLTATSVTSLADSDLNDITLITSSGNLLAGAIVAGGGIVGDVSLSAAGSVLDLNGPTANIAADYLTIVSGVGIGTVADPIETKAGNLEAATGSAGVFIANSGDLTIGGIAALLGISTQNGGGIDLSTTGSLNIAEDIVAGGAGGNVNLAAGHDVITGAILLAAAGTLTIRIDSPNADPGVGGALVIPATADIDAASAVFLGSGDNDSFAFRPDDDATSNLGSVVNTPIVVAGNGESAAGGDALSLDLAGLNNAGLLVNSISGGGLNFGNAAAVTYNGIEQVNAPPAAGAYALTLDMNGPLGAANGPLGDDFITAQVNGPNLELIVVGVNGGAPVFSGPQANIESLTVIGTSDRDTLTIRESPGGLPAFALPATGAAGGHTSPTFTSLTGYDQAGGKPVDLHFEGGGGFNTLQFALTSGRSVVYTSDDLDSSASGNVGLGSGVSLASFGTRQLGVSFANVMALDVTGAASTLTVDASSSPASDVAGLRLTGGTILHDGRSQIEPLGPSSSFVQSLVFDAGISALLVRSGAGADMIDLLSIDSLSGLTQIVLDADNLTNSDTSADTVRVQSTSGLNVPVTLLGGRGNDTFQALTSPLGGSIDGIAGPVSIAPNAGPFADDPAAGDIDALFVDDRGDADHDNVTIAETTIEGLTRFAGTPDITYRSIDTLNVTGTAGNDTFDIALNPGSDLDTVTVNGFDGDDQFYLDLNTADAASNAVPGLLSVNLNGDAGQDVFGQTPDNAPHAGTGLPVIPPLPASLPALIFAPLAFPGVNRGPIVPSTTTIINLNGGLPSSASAGDSAVSNATQGDEYGPTFDLVNIDLSPSLANPNALAIVTTVGGIATTTGYKNINFAAAEAINLGDQNKITRVEMGDLYVRGTNGNDLIQFGLTGKANIASTRVNNYIFNLAVTLKTVAYGRNGNDQIVQGNLNKPAEFYGEAGDDYLAGYSFNDLLVGGAGYDRLFGNEGDNELWGDNLQLEPTTVEATDGPDTLTGGNGSDRMYGGGGNDTLTAAAGSDYAFGGGGDDTLDGGSGDDRLYGGAGNDMLGGGDGNDLLAGNDGDDKLYGNVGNDMLVGGLGADLLAGQEGNDLLFDGTISFAGPPIPGTDASTLAGDANDQALAAILATWASGVLPPGITSNHDSSIDSLSGMQDDDTASGGADDVGDWENLLT